MLIFTMTADTLVNKEVKLFYNGSLADALENCNKEGYQALSMPEIADARIQASKEDQLWRNWLSSTSIRATGKTKQGNAVVVYAHVPNHFSEPKNIRTAIEQGLVNGAGKLPQEEFQRLLDLKDDKKVFVIDYNKLKSSTSDVIQVSKALKHSQTVPFLGGQERAEKYLERHSQVYGKNIGVWHSDDLRDEPLARLLFVGNYVNYGLDGISDLVLNGSFAGVRAVGAQKSPVEIKAPTLEDILKVSRDFVPRTCRDAFKEEIRKLYQ